MNALCSKWKEEEGEEEGQKKKKSSITSKAKQVHFVQKARKTVVASYKSIIMMKVQKKKS
jgi:hypothetical protein